MQEVNLKEFIILNLFYLLFCFGPHICVCNSSLRIFGVVTWHGSVKNTILLHTHIILPPHFTNDFYLHTTRSSHATFGHVTVTDRDTPTFVECYSFVQ